MLHDLYTTPDHLEHERERRASDLAILARAPVDLLEQGLQGQAIPDVVWLRKPQTGLTMVTGRIGGDGNPFNLGEITMTRCVLRLLPASGHACTGVGYVTGRSHRKAELVALYDALLQTPWRETQGQAVLDDVAATLARLQAATAAAVDGTRVEFFTLVREAGK